jgi:hypothetical protein
MDPFSIKLRFDDEDHTEDIFYFCHVSTLYWFQVAGTLSSLGCFECQWSLFKDCVCLLRTPDYFSFAVVAADSSIHVGSHQATQNGLPLTRTTCLRSGTPYTRYSRTV